MKSVLISWPLLLLFSFSCVLSVAALPLGASNGSIAFHPVGGRTQEHLEIDAHLEKAPPAKIEDATDLPVGARTQEHVVMDGTLQRAIIPVFTERQVKEKSNITYQLIAEASTPGPFRLHYLVQKAEINENITLIAEAATPAPMKLQKKDPQEENSLMYHLVGAQPQDHVHLDDILHRAPKRKEDNSIKFHLIGARIEKHVDIDGHLKGGEKTNRIANHPVPEQEEAEEILEEEFDTEPHYDTVARVLEVFLYMLFGLIALQLILCCLSCCKKTTKVAEVQKEIDIVHLGPPVNVMDSASQYTKYQEPWVSYI